MSLAKSGLPVAVCAPLTTQLLLPSEWRISCCDSRSHRPSLAKQGSEIRLSNRGTGIARARFQHVLRIHFIVIFVGIAIGLRRGSFPA